MNNRITICWSVDAQNARASYPSCYNKMVGFDFLHGFEEEESEFYGQDLRGVLVFILLNGHAVLDR